MRLRQFEQLARNVFWNALVDDQLGAESPVGRSKPVRSGVSRKRPCS